ncbi:anticodon-binding protein [Candidatus Woesearchaeota archaeon]|nr:anticodon-binding protein [Candidatus Woesearchaeota archaeon]
MGGLHYRTDHDLRGHQEISGENMEVMDEESGRKFIPHVLELSFGIDRNVYALLDLAYNDDKGRGNIVLKLPSRLTPFYGAVFPLVKNKPELVEKAEKVYGLIKNCYSCYYDEVGSIGRRYARADEMGVKYCLTIDFDTLQDESVTIRDRDNTNQVRVKISELKNKLFGMFFK